MTRTFRSLLRAQRELALENHAKDLTALGFFTVPTATFQVLCVLIILTRDRRQILRGFPRKKDQLWVELRVAWASCLDGTVLALGLTRRIFGANATIRAPKRQDERFDFARRMRATGRPPAVAASSVPDIRIAGSHEAA